MRSVGRGDLTDQQWRKIGPLLPAQKPRIGRPSKDHRTIINGILWVLRTGAPWRGLPKVYGPWSTVASRFYRWRKKGLWERLLSELQQEADAAGEFLKLWQVGLERYDELKALDWSWLSMDGAMTKAPLGGGGNRSQPHGPG